MSRWKELPAELSPPVRQLVVRLRRLKDHGGLSMRQLAAKTGYSAKSWERYLGGRSLPPREAVEAMARTAGDDPDRLLALHEVAAEAWSRRTTPAPEPEPERSQGRSLRVAFVAGTVALVVAVAASVVLIVRFTGSGEHPVAPPPPAPSASVSKRTYECRVERDADGRWYAGNSRTREAILAYGQAGPEVAEAQCLLGRAGFPAGAVDGIYGPLTQGAVKRIQRREGLVVDGIIGPHTWKVLRG
ncbi:peptidoglycan-binding protein [Streptomyces cinnabarinus]|uniref:Peptidoglycan-binding protein n=1 Tax=Streptomyces cinnabarinus TaxID=67287 RepID=A0ABY7KIT0_9ACTN|nr:peptidoglycan-binding protein [Streptomyces cinnabarinus]WAZ23292.1 peptidoglycan-binding protein [Streptomyces cinnabarinus]